MTFQCAAPGCTNAPMQLDRFCAAHRTRLRRYGHPLQRSVSSRDLQPFACRIASRLPEGGEVREMLAGRWNAVLAEVSAVASSGIVRDALGGPSGDRRATSQERTAARLFLATARTITTADTVADIVIGLAMLRAVHPATFEDDTAFRFIVARRFLGTTPDNAMKDRVSKSTTYKSFPTTTMLPVAEWLLGAFGDVAEKLAGQEVEAMASARAEEARLREVVASL